MRTTRLATATLLSLSALLFAAQPVAAQSSVTEALINGLNSKLLIVAIPITVLTEAALIYAVLKFKDNDDPTPTQENRRLEISWTVATAAILLFVGVASYGVLANPNVTYTDAEIPQDENAVVVHAEAFQWGWEMSYPREGNFTTGSEIVVPEGQPVYFTVTSRDVIHGFAVPGLGLKQDAMPGQVNTLRTVATEQGTYQGYCTEFCGVAHSQMYFTVEVVSQQEYQEWVESQQES